MNIYIIVQTPDDIKEVTDRLESLKITVYDVEITNIRELASQPPALVIESGQPERSPHSDVIMALAAIDGVISVEEV